MNVKLLALSTAFLLAAPAWAGPVFPHQIGEFPKPVTNPIEEHASLDTHTHTEACEEMDSAFVDEARGETIEDAQQEMTECFECVFPSEWLRGEGLDPAEAKEVAQAEINKPANTEENNTLNELLPQVVPVKLSNKPTGKVKNMGKNTITYPVAGSARFLSGLGDRRSGGRRHQGVDLGAKSGTPIVAAWAGKVQKAGQNRLGGWGVRMQHPNGKITYYAHMKTAPTVRTGQLVAAGTRLGGVGQSGNARGTTPHLHFEVHAGKKLENPLTYINK